MRLPLSTPLPSLSPRKHQICALVVEGKTNLQIAAKLKLSPDTVKDYLARIFQKIGCHNRTELAVRYVQGASVKPIRANHPTKKPTPLGR